MPCEEVLMSFVICLGKNIFFFNLENKLFRPSPISNPSRRLESRPYRNLKNLFDSWLVCKKYNQN